MMFSKRAMPLFILGALLPGACAPQQAGVAVPAPPATLSGPSNTAPGAASTQRMSQMDHSSMRGMDMNNMMAHCAQMRQQMRPGTAMSADMRQMMAQCDQMDRSMGMGTQPGR